MQLTHVLPWQVTEEQWALLLRSFNAAPLVVRPSKLQLSTDLLSGKTKLFSTGNGVVLCRVVEAEDGNRRLLLEAVCAKSAFAKSWARQLKRLAAVWRCDIIETTVYSKRLARAIMLAGAEQEAVVLTLRVGG